MNKQNEIQKMEQRTKTLELLNSQLQEMAKNAPPGGYLRAIKKKYFRPKTNWAMLSTLVGLAALLTTAIIFLCGRL